MAETRDPENTLIITLADGEVIVEMLPEVAPEHVARIKALARAGEYDNVAFHRVIDGFMAQTGDVEFGTREAFGQGRAGTGGSALPDLPAEFSDIPFDTGVVGMARSQSPDSANSQFFIMTAPAPHLNGQYTVVGRVIAGQDVVDAIMAVARCAASNPEVVELEINPLFAYDRGAVAVDVRALL